MPRELPILSKVILWPETCESLSLKQWSVLIAQARVTSLLPRLAFVVSTAELLDKVPEAPRQHLIGSINALERQRVAAANEVHFLREALADLGVPLVLLKGMAYVAANAPPGRARTFSDFDILVPQPEISRVEDAMIRHGWQGDHHDSYDERYYREWMHEIPPLLHRQRRSVLDVHHSITPQTARIRVNSEMLLERVVPSPRFEQTWTLQPIDMLLHCAVHLFNEGEFEHGLRDLFDFRDLLGHYIITSNDWFSLYDRANELGVEGTLDLALRCLKSQFGEKSLPQRLPETIALKLNRSGGITTALFERVLAPHHPSCEQPMDGVARFLLFVRGHALRMPLRLLIPHLYRKWMKSMGLLKEEASKKGG